MKKISVLALNLRFLRLPLILMSLMLCISVSVLLCHILPPAKLSYDFSQSFIRLNTVFLKPTQHSIGVFALLNATPVPGIEKTYSPQSEKSNTSAKVTSPKILSRTPQPSSDVKISNSTNHEIDAKDFSMNPPGFLKENFSILILHTHTTESYTPSDKYSYTPNDTDRTTDKSYNMVRVGNEIEKILTSNGFKVYHDTTINDYPSYNGSYNRSSANASAYIKNDPTIKIVLDVHRDAIEGANGEKVKYTTVIDGKEAACVMIVAGSNISGLKHDNWKSNLRFAVQLQQHTESIYPSLCRPINFRSQRFNQQLAPGALIIEVGTNGNTLEEALLGANYFANALSSYLKNYS